MGEQSHLSMDLDEVSTVSILILLAMLSDTKKKDTFLHLFFQILNQNLGI